MNDTERDRARTVQGEIVGGKLEVLVTCPECGEQSRRIIDYRIVEISSTSCQNPGCETNFNVKVQNVFDAALAARPVDRDGMPFLESVGDSEVRLYVKGEPTYRYLVQVTPGHARKFADAVNAALAHQPPADRVLDEVAGLYVASRASVPERGAMWRAFRDNGTAINSTWIDEDGEGQSESLSDLWVRIVAEVSKSKCLVLYAETSDFPLKGAYIEVGIALGLGKRVIICLPEVNLNERSCRPIGSWINHPLVTRIDDIGQAILEAQTNGDQ